MKKLILMLAFVSFLRIASAQEVSTTSIGIAEPISAGYRASSNCNVSPAFLDLVKDALISEMNMSFYAYSNYSSISCYEYNGNRNIYFQLILKDDEDDFIGKRISGSFYTSELVDYDILFTEEESNILGYTLKQKYLEYVVNDTDEEYYVEITPAYDNDLKNRCANLENYFDGLSGEKYFNENDYCSVIFKTRTSDLKNLVASGIGYINYIGEEVMFHFHGYSEGSYDIGSLANSLDCDLSKSDYYYPEFASDCYGIYKDKSRIYFSISNASPNAYLSVYGYVNGKAKISVSAYGEELSQQEVLDWVANVTAQYFNKAYTLTLGTDGYGLRGEAIIDGLGLNNQAFDQLSVSQRLMDKNYEGNGVYATISEPYIQVYVPEIKQAGVASSEAAIMPRPYYWSRYFIITSSRVYSEVTLNSSDEQLAVQQIKEFIDPYIETTDWDLNMTVTGGWHYPVIMYEQGVRGVDAAEIGAVGVATATSTLESAGVTGLQDSFSNQHPELQELEEEAPLNIWGSIIKFFRNLFGMN